MVSNIRSRLIDCSMICVYEYLYREIMAILNVYNSQNILKTVNRSTAEVYVYSIILQILVNSPIFGICTNRGRFRYFDFLKNPLYITKSIETLIKIL